MSMTVLRPGLLTTVQDLGRQGYQKYGVIVSGGMDSYSLRLANLLVGNEEGSGVLEMTLTGPTLAIEEDSLLAITGGDLSPTIDGQPVPMWRPVYVRQGSILCFGALKSGCRSYLAVAGGYHIPKVMGSQSTYLRAGIGGFQGRALQAGDVLTLNPPPEHSRCFMQQLSRKQPAAAFTSTSWYAGRTHIPANDRPTMIRVIRGSQFAQFTAGSQEQFWHEPFQITPKSDRMGYRLSGPVLQLAESREMISEAVVLGTIQVPPDGHPILLLADRQTTGGYPKIAQVILADIATAAQLKPGAKMRFREISLAEAEQLYIAKEQEIQQQRKALLLKWQSSCLH